MDVGRNCLNFCNSNMLAYEHALSRLEERIAMLNAGPQDEEAMEALMDMASDYRERVEDYRVEVVWLYRSAIESDVDIDGSRLLKVYRFIYRNAAQLRRQLSLVNVPHHSNAVWGIIILVAIMYLYSAV